MTRYRARSRDIARCLVMEIRTQDPEVLPDALSWESEPKIPRYCPMPVKCCPVITFAYFLVILSNMLKFIPVVNR